MKIPGRFDRRFLIGTIVATFVVALVFQVGVAPAILGDRHLVSTDFDVGEAVGEAGPSAPGDIVWIGTNTLNVVSDAKATLVDLIPLGLPANVTAEPLYMPIAGTQGALGIVSDHVVSAANRQNARPLKGVVVSRDDGYFQLLVRFAFPAGGFTTHGYLVTYTVSGETRQTYVPRSQHLCDAGTSTGACEFVEPHL